MYATRERVGDGEVDSEMDTEREAVVNVDGVSDVDGVIEVGT